MANNEQLIADLGEAINLSNASQARFGENNDSFNRTINAGLAQINATIREIDAMLGQIADRINVLKARIAELEANGAPGNDAEIAALQDQLAAAQKGQVAATEVMNRALVTLRANTEAMDGSISKQDEPAMTAQLQTINNSLQAMQARLRGILNDNQGPLPPPADQSAVERMRAAQDPDSDDEATPETGPGTVGGKRRRKNKTAKKQRKSRRTKKNKKQKGGYGYKTKQRKYKHESDTSSASSSTSLGSSSIGRGRGMYKKSKKRRISRS
jgi:uncharacterized protein YdcH (DUF465 family)